MLRNIKRVKSEDNIKAPVSKEQYINNLSSIDPTLRLQAIIILSNSLGNTMAFSNKVSIKTLIRLTKDDNTEVRRHAAEILAKLSSKKNIGRKL